MGKDGGNSILSNLNTKIFMRVPDPETAAHVTKHFGTRRRMIASTQMNSSDVNFREIEEDLLDPSNVLNLQPRQFYMTTYSGNYQGVTANVEGSRLQVEFPEISTAVLDSPSLKPLK